MFRTLLLLGLLLLAPAALADDAAAAREAVLRGEAVPLREILDLAERDYDGSMLEVELEREHGRLIYEVKLLTPAGNVIELEYDARTKELLKVEGRGAEQARRQR